MQFKLIINGDGVRKHNMEVIREALSKLDESDDNYIILEPKKAIEKSIYLQAAIKDGKCVAEIRFVFSNDTFRHYSKAYDKSDELYKLFEKYYSDNICPDINDWIDETFLFKDDLEDDLVKLYKKEDNSFLYFECWLNDNDSLTVHYGLLGNIGETVEYLAKDMKLPLMAVMTNLVYEKQQSGYSSVVSRTELIIECTPGEDENFLSLEEQRTEIEDLLNNCLGWTGNGHCESSYIIGQTLDFICFVVDKNIACQTILDALAENKFTGKFIIGYADEINEEYLQLYPESGKSFRFGQ